MYWNTKDNNKCWHGVVCIDLLTSEFKNNKIVFCIKKDRKVMNLSTEKELTIKDKISRVDESECILE